MVAGVAGDARIEGVPQSYEAKSAESYITKNTKTRRLTESVVSGAEGDARIGELDHHTMGRVG